MIIYLKNPQVLDADQFYIKEDLLIIDGRIEVAETVGEDLADMVLDLSGYTVMPGIVDSHIHVSSRKGPSEKLIEGMAAHGILTVRDMGLLNEGGLEEYLNWLSQHDDPRFSRVVTAGRYIDVPGGYGMGPDGQQWGIQITCEDEAEKAVSYQAEHGVSWIKTGISDGFTGPIRSRIGSDLLKAISEAAKERGIRSSAHIGRCEDLAVIVENGLSDAAHTPGDGEISDECIRKMVREKVTMITTVGDIEAPCRFLPKGYHSEEEFRSHQKHKLKNLKKFFDAGGMIGIGTDRQDRDGSGGNTGIPVWEMKQLYDAGIPFSEVLRSATENGAKICGLSDTGSVRAGMRADLIAFKGRLSNDFHELAGLSLVIHDGVIINNKL